MTWYKIPHAKEATVRITIDSQENNIQISNESISTVKNEGKTVIEFNYMHGEHYPYGQGLYFDFLSEKINIEATNCPNSNGIHFEVDIEFQGQDGSDCIHSAGR
ncbi:hypothetical protein [Wolbachia endosymbiont of Ctenocephalides felis wCfeT]|uniref:hypothetical protein n=1 Tax=Wolbachia endosymbiont of Ctenocephalides felis wCfeT TaxID=2732593 RepID=UPI0014487BD4|nr:hypothetical protein [Wolbachia endosymbiont of Ctenocephalides felis wCfeT]